MFPKSSFMIRYSLLLAVGILLPRLAAAQDPMRPVPVPARPDTMSTIPGGRTAAQDAAAAMGRSVSNAQIAEAIKNSGLSESQIRARLQAAGFDTRLADPFFTGSAGNPAAAVDPSFVSALQSLGILDLTDLPDETRIDTQLEGRTADSTRSGTTASLIFGKSIFRSGSSAFDPVAAGPVDAAYRLGYGDQLQLVITGDMEMAAALSVRRDGSVVIPQIGQIAVAGLQLESARALVTSRAAQVFGVVRAGKAHVDLSVARVRSNQVFVVGEVERPGSYQVSALGTVFRALAAAGGPSAQGTFRNIEVRRGGSVAATVDLYDYLLRGDASKDVRLEQGDIVFVGVNRRAVTVRGAVRRPGIFELRDGEGFADLLGFAGGLLPVAVTDRIQIDRVLPPEQRTPGKERTVLDVAYRGRQTAIDSVKIYDNDIITVFTVGKLRRNQVNVAGEVFQPGTYEWAPGMTLSTLIAKAQGFLPWALTDRIKVERALVETGRSEVYSVSARDSSWKTFAISEFDSVTVLDARTAFPERPVTISGAVVTPGARTFKERQTLRDLIDLAGGYRPEAAVVDLSRRHVGERYSDTTAIVRSFAILRNGRLEGNADTTTLEPWDEVNVRVSPGYREVQTVRISGLVTYPGNYVLARDGERISEVVRRAGGLLPSAYPQSARLIRKGRPVTIDFAKALQHERNHDIAMADGDQLQIGPDPSVVYVAGAVERQVVVPFHSGWKIDDYVSAAGGFSNTADDDNVIVEYPSGEIGRREHHFFGTREPAVLSGSTITVGRKPEDKGSNVGENLTRTMQIATTLVSIFLAYKTATR